LGIAWITDTETDAIRLGMPRGSCQCELWMTPQQRGRLRPGPVQLSRESPYFLGAEMGIKMHIIGA
jgi:hypothetical protein